MADRFTIVGLGEAFYELGGGAAVPGGTALGVAVYAQQLAAACGGRGVLVSRAGQDDLGRQMRELLASHGMGGEFLQSDPDYATGTAYAGPEAGGGRPTREVTANVAWDWLQYDPDLEGLARSCDAVGFGVLALREGQSRNTAYRFLEAARRALRLFDLDLAAASVERRTILRALEFANAVQASAADLALLAEMVGGGAAAPAAGDADTSQAAVLLRKCRLRLVSVLGEDGSVVLHSMAGRAAGLATEGARQQVAWARGARQAAAAAVLVGAVRRWAWDRTAAVAAQVAALGGQSTTPLALPPEATALART